MNEIKPFGIVMERTVFVLVCGFFSFFLKKYNFSGTFKVSEGDRQ